MSRLNAVFLFLEKQVMTNHAASSVAELIPDFIDKIKTAYNTAPELIEVEYE